MTTLIIPVRDRADRIGVVLRNWADDRQCQDITEFIVIDDGSIDDTPNVVQRMQEKISNLSLIRHERPLGFGACVRSGLRQAGTEFVATLSLDYPYLPSDYTLLLKRMNEPSEVFGEVRPIGVISGCRSGLPAPAFWKVIGRIYRNFLRVSLGFKPEPLPGWLGLRNHCRSWWLWLTMGVPLVDVSSGLRIYRRELLDRIIIQSDGDFAHAEVIAKLTFLGTLIAEVPLPPRKAAVVATDFGEFWTVFRNARFTSPACASEPCPPV